MAKEVQYNSDYVDGHMRSLKIEDDRVALRVGKDKAKFTGDLAVEGKIDVVKTDLIKDGTGNGILVESARAIKLDSVSGNFHMLNAGTEFSVSGSFYAGTIIGYRCIGEDATPVVYTLTASMTVIHSDANVSFIAPPSGNVEINFQVHYYGGNGATVTFGISTADSYSALSAPSAQYEKVSFDVSRFDDAIINQNWVITGLTPGTSTQYWIGTKTSSTSGSPTLKYGGDSAGENVPLIIKVTALPTATTDYAVYG